MVTKIDLSGFVIVAEKYDLSPQQVKNIVYKAMDRLEKHL